MINNEQVAYIEGLKVNYPGLDDETIRKVLSEASWTPEHIKDALARYHSEDSLPPPPVDTDRFSKAVLPIEHTISSYSPTPTQNSNTNSHTGRTLGILLGVMILVSGLGVAGYYVYTQTSFFDAPKLSNENVLQDIFAKLGEIKTANYDLEFALSVNNRDADAESYDTSAPVAPEVLAKYGRDEDRIRDVTSIKSTLDMEFYDSGKYPTTLIPIGTKTTDPLGVPYTYTRTADGTGFSLVVTFETQEAADAILNDYYFDESDSVPVSKTVTITNEDYISGYGFTGEPAKPKLFGFYDISEIETSLPANLSAKFSVGGTMDSSNETPVDVRVHVAGEASLDDANFAFDAEGIKKGDAYYGIINKLPALFSSMSQIRGKWVKVTKDDLANYGYSDFFDEIVPTDDNEDTNRLKKSQEQAQKLFELANSKGLITITAGPVSEIINGEKLTKYELAIVRENLLPFYEEAVALLEPYGEDSIMKRDETLVEQLKSEQFSKDFEYLKKNTTFTMWLDKKGYPVKSELAMRYVPSDDARALKDKQLNVSFTLVFKDINKPVNVTIPETSITFDELMSEITGMSKEELMMERQSANVNNIRQAISSYYSWTGKYPTTLDELTKLRKDVTKQQVGFDSLETSYGGDYLNDMPFLKHVPLDAYTKAAYRNTATAYDYELKYEIQLQPYTKEKNPRNYYTYPGSQYNLGLYGDIEYSEYMVVLVPKFVNGENIATKDRLSQAELQNTDSDADGLSNDLETIFGTDKAKADTDSDGYNDMKEITSGSNPLGPGKLDFDYGYGYGIF